jgi:hypothetical protein
MALPIQTAGSGAPTRAVYEGALYQREDTSNGEVYVGHAGVWVRLLRSNEGVAGLVTLAGDVTGPASSNTVVGLTGSAGVIAVHAAGLFWDAAVTGATIKQVAAISGAGGNLSIIAQNGALGSNGGALILSSGAGVIHGNIAFDLGGGLVASFDASINSFLLAMPSVLFNSVQTSPTIKQIDAAGGAGQPLNIIAQKGGSNSNGGPLFFATGAGQGSGVAGPVVFQLGTTIFAELTVADNGLLMLAPNITFGPSVAAPTISQTAVTGINAQHMTIAAQGVSGLGGLAANLRLMGGNDTASGQLGGYVEVYGGDGSGGQVGGFRQFFGRTTPVLAQRAVLVPGTANHFEWYQVDGATLLADLTDTTGFSLHTVAVDPAGVAGRARIYVNGSTGTLSALSPQPGAAAPIRMDLVPGGTLTTGVLRYSRQLMTAVNCQTSGTTFALLFSIDLSQYGDGLYWFEFRVLVRKTNGSNESGMIYQMSTFRELSGAVAGVYDPGALQSGGAGITTATIASSAVGSTVTFSGSPGVAHGSDNLDWSGLLIIHKQDFS